MFTGLVSAVARVVSLRSGAAGAVLAVERPPDFGDAAVGESIAVSGVCLTVVPPAAPGQPLFFDVSPETLSRSALGNLASGAGVNLERALRASDRLGGHIVTGHVDGVGGLASRREVGEALALSFTLPGDLAPYVAEKGSIAINGVSMTVNAAGKTTFDVMVIPI